jgi:hypothetical protein
MCFFPAVGIVSSVVEEEVSVVLIFSKCTRKTALGIWATFPGLGDSGEKFSEEKVTFISTTVNIFN